MVFCYLRLTVSIYLTDLNATVAVFNITPDIVSYMIRIQSLEISLKSPEAYISTGRFMLETGM